MGQEGKLREGPAGGGVWWMRCAWEREKSVEVGDHIVVVGSVLEAGEYEGGRKRLAGVYVNGEYRRVDEMMKDVAQERNKP